jgi:hypothetical protein
MLRANGESPPMAVNGVPFTRWMREFAGGPLIDDSRYTIHDGGLPLT